MTGSSMAEACSAIILVIGTLFLPPVGVFFISGCSPDLLVNVILTFLGYLPGHLHAFYCIYIYYDRRARGGFGRVPPAPGIFSKRIQNGGESTRIRDDYNSSTPFPYPPTPPPPLPHSFATCRRLRYVPNFRVQGRRARRVREY